MHHPTDRIIHTTAFVTPVVEHWLTKIVSSKQCIVVGCLVCISVCLWFVCEYMFMCGCFRIHYFFNIY